MNEINKWKLWLFERPSHGKKHWALINTYPTKEAAKVAMHDLIGGRISKSRLRITRPNAPAPVVR